MSNTKAVRVCFPDSVKQEIQALLAVNCRELVYQGKDAKEEAQFEKMRKAFHGSENHSSLLTQFMEGKKPFDCCFTEEDMQNNREGNEDRTDKMLRLKECLHCIPTGSFHVNEKGFIREAIANSRGNPLTGRAINDKYRCASANYKHALRFYNEFCTDGKYPSGTNYDDMIQYVREKMFLHLHGAKDQQGCNRLLKKAAETYQDLVEKAKADGSDPPAKPLPLIEEDMPDDYLFTGYFAFVVFGPDGLSKTSISCFTVDGKKVTKVGRAAQRKQEAKQKAMDREKKYYPDDFNRRGISIHNQAVAAQMAQREASERRRIVSDQLFTETQNHGNYLKELDTVNGMLKDAKKREANENEIGYLEAWQGGVFDRLQGSRKRKADLEAECDRLMKAQPTKVITNYYDLVAVDDSPAKALVFQTPDNNSTGNGSTGGDGQ